MNKIQETDLKEFSEVLSEFSAIDKRYFHLVKKELCENILKELKVVIGSIDKEIQKMCELYKKDSENFLELDRENDYDDLEKIVGTHYFQNLTYVVSGIEKEVFDSNNLDDSFDDVYIELLDFVKNNLARN